MAEREAFKVSSYFDKNGFNQRAFARGLADLAIEAGDHRPIEERIVPFTLKQLGSRVVNLALDMKDVAEHYSEATQLDRQEKLAGLKMRDCLMFYPDETVSLWISPPGGPLDYDEGRMVVGVNKSEGNIKKIEAYGFPISFSGDECLEIANCLSVNENYGYKNVETLRSSVFILTQANSWEVLKAIIPLSKIWQAIESKGVDIFDQEIYRQAVKITENIVTDFGGNLQAHQYGLIGYMAEMQMRQKGNKMSSGPCGALPSDLYTDNNGFETGYGFEVTRLDEDGNTMSVENSHGTFVYSCGECGNKINSVMKSGDKCKGCKKAYACG